jgi:hypothetical protein
MLGFHGFRDLFFRLTWFCPESCACMYLLTIRDGLHTRHIGPYRTPQDAAAQLDQLLLHAGERAHWQIHELEPPQGPVREVLVSSSSAVGPAVVAAA